MKPLGAARWAEPRARVETLGARPEYELTTVRVPRHRTQHGPAADPR
ncbi:hypothetical protein [Streptomyces sp. NPDC004296]